MRTFNLFFLLISLLVACSSCRSTVRTINTDRISVSDSLLRVDVSGRADMIQSRISSFDGAWRIVYYDTSLPADPDTGLSPVLAIAEGSVSGHDSCHSSYVDTLSIHKEAETHNVNQEHIDQHDESHPETTTQDIFLSFTKLVRTLAFLVFMIMCLYAMCKFLPYIMDRLNK